MNIHDPNRPKIFHRPAFTHGTNVIPQIQIWPLNEDGTLVEFSLMLPVLDQRFTGRWKSIKVTAKDLPELVSEFTHDPEAFVKRHIGLDISQIKSHKEKPAQEVPESDKPKMSYKSILELL